MPWGQGKKMTLTFHTLISSISCLHLTTVRSQASTVSKNPLFSIFPIEKPKLQYLAQPLSRSRSTQGHHLNKLWWAGVPDATYQVSWESAHRFWKRKFLKDFNHIWTWRPSWSCDQHHVINFLFPCTWKLIYKIWLKWPGGFLENKF